MDEIYATLVVHLHHTQHFQHDQLWQDAADFLAANGKQIGIKLSTTGEGGGRLEIYCDSAVGVGQQIQFVGYVHAHLNQRATNVKRFRHYTCQTCGEPLADLAAVENRLSRAKADIGCSYCDARVALSDELEQLYGQPDTAKKVRDLEEEVVRRI